MDVCPEEDTDDEHGGEVWAQELQSMEEEWDSLMPPDLLLDDAGVQIASPSSDTSMPSGMCPLHPPRTPNGTLYQTGNVPHSPFRPLPPLLPLHTHAGLESESEEQKTKGTFPAVHFLPLDCQLLVLPATCAADSECEAEGRGGRRCLLVSYLPDTLWRSGVGAEDEGGGGGRAGMWQGRRAFSQRQVARCMQIMSGVYQIDSAQHVTHVARSPTIGDVRHALQGSAGLSLSVSLSHAHTHSHSLVRSLARSRARARALSL